MAQFAIKTEGLTKTYRLGQKSSGSLRYAIQNALSLRWPRRSGALFRALDDISFELAEGEALGVIGRNGAGKSTLLKILSRITLPSDGRVLLRGRTAALLEVGTGFHPELTGRENVFLNGAILGMSRREIKSKFDEIIAFSGVEQFVDTPVKRYSSGMYVRLAFAVAAHLEPEILIIDEVLAVGDVAFQQKCLAKMKHVANSGRTVLFVSHNMSAVSTLCNRCILLDKGKLVQDGPAQQVVEAYLSAGNLDFGAERRWSPEEMPPGKPAQPVSARFVTNKMETAYHSFLHEPVGIEIIYALKDAGANVIPGIKLKTERGETAFSARLEDGLPVEKPGTYRALCWLPPDLLNEGRYALDLSLCHYGARITGHFYEEDVIRLQMIENLDYRKTPYRGKIVGVFRPALKWELKKLD